MQGKRKGETMASDEKKILIVEDEKVIRDAVSAYLERENYVVKGVGDGQSAVEEFEKHAFDLVILDLMLPKLSGERVCRLILRINKHVRSATLNYIKAAFTCSYCIRLSLNDVRIFS